MNSYKLDLEKYAALARQAAAEGCVLLENEEQALPLREGERVAVFGRMAFHYYKSGLGSGGLVNTRYVVGILDALKECETVHLDEKLMGIYEDWIQENPYDEGQGWGRVPWCQKEMEVTEEMHCEYYSGSAFDIRDWSVSCASGDRSGNCNSSGTDDRYAYVSDICG